MKQRADREKTDLAARVNQTAVERLRKLKGN